jgi:outer membrane protein
MKVPIFDSGLTNAKTKQAKLDLQKTKNDFENFEKAAALQFQVSNTNFVSSLADEQIAKKTLVLSEKIYKTTSIKFKEGVGSSFELVQSEQELIQNKLKQIQTTLNVLTHKADLDKAMGTK